MRGKIGLVGDARAIHQISAAACTHVVVSIGVGIAIIVTRSLWGGGIKSINRGNYEEVFCV